MAQIVICRLPQATPQYATQTFDTLVRELEQIVQQLNFGYQQETKDETLARNWFIG